MKNHVPLRMCMACREMKSKSELIRFVSQGNKVVLDSDMKIQARGAYLCHNKQCAQMAKKKRCLERHLRADCAYAYAQLENMFSEVDTNE